MIIIKNEIVKKLYELYYRQVYLYLYSMSRSHAVAEDLAQDTFLKAILSLNDNHPNVKAWLFLVAKNQYLSYIKSNKKTIDLSEMADAQSPDSNPIEIIISDEKNICLLDAIDKLSDNKRQIIILQYFAELSQKEIARVLNLNPNNVRVLSMRAKAELKKIMEENL